MDRYYWDQGPLGHEIYDSKTSNMVPVLVAREHDVAFTQRVVDLLNKDEKES